MENIGNKWKETEWLAEDAPTERLYSQGRMALNDAELLSIVIGDGELNAKWYAVAKEVLLLVDNNISQLGKVTMSELQRIKGVGKFRAAKISASLELGRRRHYGDPHPRREIRGSRDGYNIVAKHLEDLHHEEAYFIGMDKKNRVVGVRRVSVGGTDSTIVDARVVFRVAIEVGATAFMLAHNHPSGSLRPSQADIELTKKLKNVGESINIPIIDHLIVSNEGYFSFLDEGLI